MAKTMRKNTNAGMRGGASCSSDEAFVMKAERREALSCQRTLSTSGDEWREFEQTLQHSEARDMGGLSAGQNQPGAAGIDDETIADFERNLPKNLYKLWNRMSSGSYFRRRSRLLRYRRHRGYTQAGSAYGQRPYRTNCSQTLIEPKLDALFHPDSYGYRPGRSAKQAMAITRERCWRYDWVVEFDIKAAFDQIDHELLMKAVRTHIKEDWILLYIERWLVAPFEAADGVRIQRERGTPQGGVISPMLMNLFMHYTFDA
jgi:hypothetical protein